MDEGGTMWLKALFLTAFATIGVAGFALPFGVGWLLAASALFIGIAELYHRMTVGGKAPVGTVLLSILIMVLGVLVALTLAPIGMNLQVWLLYVVALYWFVETGMKLWEMGKRRRR